MARRVAQHAWKTVLRAGAIALACLALDARADRIVIADVSVIPMVDETILEHRDVVIDGDRISSIHPHVTTVDAIDADRIIDGTGRYLIPGLCDLHVHIRGRPDEAKDMLALYPANGITTVLNMGGNRFILRLRDDVEQGEQFGPRILTASPILGNIHPTPATEEDGREMVARYADDGYDFIKVYNHIPEPGYRGVIAEAKEQGIPVVGHAVRSVGIEGALESGQHIAHMEEIIYGYFQDDLDASRIRPLAERLKEANVDVIATLIVYHNILRQLDDIDAMLRSPGIEYVGPSVSRTFQPDNNPYLQQFDRNDVEERLRPHWAFLQKLTRIFHEEGVRILAGTDAPVEIVVPGYSLHDELEELVEAGLTPYDALAAATVDAASFLGLADEIGTLEPGKTAEAVLLNADPLEDIRNSKQIAGIMIRGEWLSREELDRRLESIRK